MLRSGHKSGQKGGKMDREKVAKRLVDLRGDRSQREVAEAIGVSQATYSYYESGKRMPRDDVKFRIASYYKKTVNQIFFK